MRLWIVIPMSILLGAALLVGCGKARSPREEAAAAGSHDDHEGHDDHEAHGGEKRAGEGHEGEGHEGEGHHEGEAEEGHVAISSEVLKEAGIEFAPVGPRALAQTIEFAGEVSLNTDRLAHIVPRFPGVAREVRKQLGDRVRAGNVMAIIESNESLTSYEVKSLTSGTVIEKHITLGEFVRDNTDIYVVADLSTVWLNLVVPPRELAKLRTGQTVRVRAAQSDETATGKLTYIGPLVTEETRSVTARAALDNASGHWRPGLFASGRIEIGQEPVTLAVPHDALHTIGGSPALFVRTADGVEARPVKTGREDGEWIEILSGVAQGEVVAVTRTFLLKAELGKAEAEHSH